MRLHPCDRPIPLLIGHRMLGSPGGVAKQAHVGVPDRVETPPGLVQVRTLQPASPRRRIRRASRSRRRPALALAPLSHFADAVDLAILRPDTADVLARPLVPR